MLMYVITCTLLIPQIEYRDIIGQEIISFEAVYKMSKLMDQFCDGLRSTRILNAVRAFPELFIQLLTYTGDVSSESVLEALSVDRDSPTELFEFLRRFILKAAEEGKGKYYR